MKQEVTSPYAVLMHDLRGGGYERMMVNLIRQWCSLGENVDLVLVDPAGEYMRHVPAEVRVIDLGKRRTSRSLVPLVGYLRRERPRALLSGLAHLNVLAAMAHTISGVGRLVLSERNTPSEERLCGDAATRHAYRLARWAYGRADAAIAVSEGVADDAAETLRVPRQQFHVISNPVVTDELLAQSLERCHHPWLIEGPPVVLAVGRLARQKDFATLIEAFAIVRRKKTCRLVIAGDGAERNSLQALADGLGVSTDIDMPGFQENPYCLMSHCAAFVLSSAYEGSPNVLVEAMACGAPVISTDCPHGPREILKGGQLAPLVAVGDSNGLARELLLTLDRPRPEHLKERAADFHVTKSAALYLDVMKGQPFSPCG